MNFSRDSWFYWEHGHILKGSAGKVNKAYILIDKDFKNLVRYFIHMLTVNVRELLIYRQLISVLIREVDLNQILQLL